MYLKIKFLLILVTEGYTPLPLYLLPNTLQENHMH